MKKVMKKVMKNVRSSYLQLSNIFSGRVEFSNRVVEAALQLDLSSQVQHFNSTRLEFKKFLTRLDTFQVENSTRTRVLDSTQSVYINDSDVFHTRLEKSCCDDVLHCKVLQLSEMQIYY